MIGALIRFHDEAIAELGASAVRELAKQEIDALLGQGSVTIIGRRCGMLKVGDGHGIHLNTKPTRAQLRRMRLAFGWTWVEDSSQLVADHADD